MKRVAIYALLAIACGSSPALGGMLTFQVPFTITMTASPGERSFSGSITVNLPQFPGSQFDLTNVSLDVNASILASATAQNMDSVMGTFGVRYLGTFHGTGPGPRSSDGEPASTIAASPVVELAAFNGVNGSGPSFVNFGMFSGNLSTESIPTFGLNRLYAGFGEFPVTINAGASVTTEGTLDNVFLNTLSVQLVGNAVVTYTSVPEPSSLILATVGVLGLVACRRFTPKMHPLTQVRVFG